jgi:hypothetical protein
MPVLVWLSLVTGLIRVTQAQTLPTQAQVPYVEGIPQDLACAQGPNNATWAKVKMRFHDLLEQPPSGPFQPASAEAVQSAVSQAIEEINAVGGFAPPAEGGEAECGFGKVLLQLLSLVLVEDAGAVSQIFRTSEALASPVLTVLLDLPWVETALSGWPFFGILAQVAFHKVAVLGTALDTSGIDGLSDASTRTYYNQVVTAQQTADIGAMAVAAASYMQAPVDMMEQGEPPIFGSLAAATTQALAQTDVQQRLDLMHGIQGSLRSRLGSAADLEVALTTRWPIWSLLHVCVDIFSGIASA